MPTRRVLPQRELADEKRRDKATEGDGNTNNPDRGQTARVSVQYLLAQLWWLNLRQLGISGIAARGSKARCVKA